MTKICNVCGRLEYENKRKYCERCKNKLIKITIMQTEVGYGKFKIEGKYGA